MSQLPSLIMSKRIDLGQGIRLPVPSGIRNANKIPYFPWTKKILNRWGQIIALSELECGAPWELYVETAVPAFLILIKTVIEPGKIDIIKARLNHSYNCGFKKLFHDAEKFLPVGSPLAKKFLFRVTGPVFVLNWWFFLADAFTEFVYNWESAVIQKQQCIPSPIGGPCQVSNANQNNVNANSWTQITFDTIDNDPTGWAKPGGICTNIFPNRIASYKAYSAVSFKNSTPLTQTVSLRIRDFTGHIIAGPSSVTIPPNSTGADTVFGTIATPTGAAANFSVEYEISASHFLGVQAHAGSFTVAGQ